MRVRCSRRGELRAAESIKGPRGSGGDGLTGLTIEGILSKDLGLSTVKILQMELENFVQHYEGVKDPHSPVSERLRALQCAFEGEDRGATSRMAQRVGVPWSRWHNVINGFPLSMQLMKQILEKPDFRGLSADWLLYGRTEALSDRMVQKLQLTTVKREADSSR